MSEDVVHYVVPIEQLSFDAAELMRTHPPRIHNDRKFVIASVAAPPDAVHSRPSPNGVPASARP